MGWQSNNLAFPIMAGAAISYKDKVLNYSPIAYWILGEAAGSNAACEVDSNQDGTYTGVTLGQTGIGDGNTCPLFDGINDWIDIDTATLVSNFSGTEGSFIYWFKVFNVGVWTDATQRRMYDLYADAQNRIYDFRSATNNRITLRYEANNELDSHNYDSLSSTGWIHIAKTWSDSGNAVVYYRDGANKITDAANSTWVGALDLAEIGRKAGSDEWWHGYIAHVALFDSVLSDADIADLAVV